MVEVSVGRESSDRVRCIRRPAPVVKLSVRYPSSRPKEDLFTAGTATQKDEDIETPVILPSNWDFGPVRLG